MYKPTLRRKLPNDQSSILQPILPLHEKTIISQPSNKNHFHNFQIPTKIVQPPLHNKKEVVHLISPLLVQIHTYPQAVKTHVESINQQDLTNRGIGAYKQINWFFKGKTIVVWITDSTKLIEMQLEEEISCMAIGELKDRCLPAKLKRNYLMAIGCREYLILYTLNPYTLESNVENFRYKVKNSLQISKIKFIFDSKILVATSTGAIQLVQIVNISQTKRNKFPFYYYFKPVSLNSNKINCKQLLYTPKRIFALYNEIIPKYWVVKIWDSMFGDDPSDTYKKTYIVVYEIKPNQLQQYKKITAREIQKKIKSILPQWNMKSEITSIYLDYTNDIEGQLGIVTNDGCFLVLKNNKQNYISKEPVFIPKINQLGWCEFLQQKKLEPLRSSNVQQNKIETQQVTKSLGYQNLSLIEKGLFWVGDQRIDGVLLTNPNIEIIDKNQQAHLNLVQQNRQWGLYTLANNYYTIRQQPLRSFVGLLIYIRGSLNHEYEGFHYKQQKFKEFIEKQVKKLRPQRFLKYLIEIIVLKEKGISVNDFMLEMIDHEMRQQNPIDFKEWNHMLSKDIKKREILLTQDMFKYIWSLILVLQYKQTTPADIEDKSYSSTNVYWLAMHSIYYRLISPLLDLDHSGFKSHKNQVQQAYLLLKSLQSFVQKKELLENHIRHNRSNKQDTNKSYWDLHSTEDSKRVVNDMMNITSEAQNIVLSKVFNEKHNIIEQKVKSAITSTIILMSIYFNLEGYIQLNGFNINKLGITSFKNILISRESQKRLKSFIVARTSYDALQDLKTKLPFFYVDEDLAFMRCLNKIKLENRPKNELDLKQLGNSITSEYFEEADKIFQNRMDLKFKMLEHYYQKIQEQKQKLLKDYAQYIQNRARKQIFSQDEEQMLQHKRTYLQNQIEKIVNEQKRCIKRAVEIQNQQKQNKNYNYSIVMDQLIISLSGSIVLLDYIQSELTSFNLVKQCNQVEKIKNRYYAEQKNRQIKDPFYREYIPRELFPNRTEL